MLCVHFVRIQVCNFDVSARVCPASGGQAWRQAPLPSLGQHPAPGPRGPPHEGQHQIHLLLSVRYCTYIALEICSTKNKSGPPHEGERAIPIHRKRYCTHICSRNLQYKIFLCLTAKLSGWKIASLRIIRAAKYSDICGSKNDFTPYHKLQITGLWIVRTANCLDDTLICA